VKVFSGEMSFIPTLLDVAMRTTFTNTDNVSSAWP